MTELEYWILFMIAAISMLGMLYLLDVVSDLKFRIERLEDVTIYADVKGKYIKDPADQQEHTGPEN